MKTLIRRLDSLTHNDTTATKLINDNFEALQQGIEDALSRSGKTPNYMDAELDMNMRRIINGGYPINNTDMATKEYVDDVLTNGLDVYSKEETDDLLSAKQDALVSGTNIKTLNGESLLGSGNITIDADNGIIAIHEFYMDEAIPTESTGLKTLVHNMASYVEDGVEYMPMFIARTHFEKMSRTIQYDSSTKYIRIYYYHTYGTQDRMYGTLYLVPVDRQGSDSGTLKGLTNGMLVVDEGTWETGVLQTTSNLVTSVSSASTDEQYPSAKLFYDTCGDIETLINAL